MTGPNGPTSWRRIYQWGAQWGSPLVIAAMIAVISMILAFVLTPWFWLGVAFGIGAFVAVVILFRRTGSPSGPQ